ncbi:MAG: Malate dehydrogenase (Oxaloacetate-decarboxylating)(NADP+) [Parcubacteria group bacterium GW2011_GWA2_44_12]|nr:MAG: Malate dehydrogenase (Oxaloacetate-decarboxylating)(NADP+) [Parcubacteria group bacterium GW2011_GWA2_44_12]
MECAFPLHTNITHFINFMDNLKKKALRYHALKPAGKIKITSSKPCASQEDLSLAYSPGVAYPCLEISKDQEISYTYTSRAHTVGVITDGSAVLGLGNIGALASMPVMEGKAILLQRFAGLNGIPLAIKGHVNKENFIHIVASLEANFGAINLEDIKAPECFDIEETLSKSLNIPVFHDDQHGTAIISLAGILGSLELVGKKLNRAKIVINGAGAAGIASAKLYVHAGAKRENITLLDSAGVIYAGRDQNLNQHKLLFARKNSSLQTLAQAIRGADIFVGVSVANILTREMIQSMNSKPIIFALANPFPEIMPDRAKKYGAMIVATGRSDFPNQINNVLGFPGIFRGTLDVRASRITIEMKLAAAQALNDLTKEAIPKQIQTYLSCIYKDDGTKKMFAKKEPLDFDYIIPKPFDPRVVPRVAKHVAQSAMQCGIAKKPIKNLRAYENTLLEQLWCS